MELSQEFDESWLGKGVDQLFGDGELHHVGEEVDLDVGCLDAELPVWLGFDVLIFYLTFYRIDHACASVVAVLGQTELSLELGLLVHSFIFVVVLLIA